MADQLDTMECARCHGEVHPDAEACRHCGATFDEGRFTAPQRAILAWVAAAVCFFGGTFVMTADQASREGTGTGWVGAVMWFAAVPIGIYALYATIRAATR